MERAVPDYLAEATQETTTLVAESTTDPKDLEILVAAIDARCTHLVTFNLKDFDIAYASARNVAIIHPDEFLEKLIENNLEAARKDFCQSYLGVRTLRDRKPSTARLSKRTI